MNAAPNDMQPQIMLGDVLTAMHRNARPAYEKALAITQTMEPEAKAIWTTTIQQKLAHLQQ